jgi:DNA-binding GntR family transcriptional regulator
VTLSDTLAAPKGGPGNGADLLFHGMLEAISRQRLPPRTKLPEEGLAQIFNVSRAQVRSALSRLQLRGLVEMEPNRTAQIAAPSTEETRAIFDVRLWIEPEIAAEVAMKLDAKGAAVLNKHLAQDKAAREAGDRIEATRLAGQFHNLIASFSNNSIARHYVQELVDRSFLSIYLYQRVGSLMCVNEEHEDLAKVFRKRDAEAARRVMAEHLRHIVDRLDLETPSGQQPDLRLAFRGIVGEAK